jgi:hypothetical protein
MCPAVAGRVEIMSGELTSDEARILHYMRQRGMTQTGGAMRDLGIQERAVNEALHVLADGREDLIIARSLVRAFAPTTEGS